MRRVLYCAFLTTACGGAHAGEPRVLEVAKGLSLSGTLDKAKPQRAYHVKLDKGGTYVIDMISPNPRVLDPFLRLLDASGKLLMADDDGGVGLNARLIFLAPATASYRIVATSADGRGAGPFTLEVKRDDSKEADALVRQVDLLRSAGHYAAALRATRALVKVLRERRSGPSWQSVDAARMLQSLEKIAALSEPARAEFAEAVKLQSQVTALRRTGHDAQAIPKLESIVEIHRRHLGEDDLMTVASINQLAVALNAAGKYRDADPLFRKALAICRKILGDGHPTQPRPIITWHTT